MVKIKTLRKKIECDLGMLDLRITMVKGSVEDDGYFSPYAVISETDDCMAYASVGYDYDVANTIAEKLFMYDVAPQSLCDVVKEMYPAMV